MSDSPARTCTECPNPVTGRQMTCSSRCRARRSRRMHAEAAGTRPGPRPDEIALALSEADRLSIIQDVFAQEMTPHVREAITDDVLKGLAAMAGLTETLVESIAADLSSSDPVARGRAQTLMAKYLFGQIDGGKSQGNLTVNLGGIPTPAANPGATVLQDSASDAGDAPTITPPQNREKEPEAAVLRECPECGVHQPESRFEQGAERCDDCQEKLRQEVEGRFARAE